jgi:NTE family protein
MAKDSRSVLETAAIGTAVNDLITPCREDRPPRRKPVPPAEGTPIAVALSGGGFRATLAALGVLRFLADAGLLGRVRYVSSVSGGSVANGVLAVNAATLREGHWTRNAFDRLVLGPFVDSVSSRSVSRSLLPRAWRLIGRTTRTDLLAEEFDRRFFKGQLLESLDPEIRWIFNAANTATGVRFGFERDLVGDYVIGQIRTAGTGLRLTTAVAASAAVPGLLAPVELTGLPDFPCQRGRVIRLVDGGTYDNMGLEPVDALQEALLVALNAGGLFVTGRTGKIPLLKDLQLAQSLLYRQTTAVRMRWMVERFKSWENASGEKPEQSRLGILFGLGTTIDPTLLSGAWSAVNPTPPVPDEVARVATSFDQFDRGLCRKLVYAGWWLTGASLATHHPEQLPSIPAWTWDLG